ncbi:MAG TPA: hypothetical protein VHM90_02440 [Phycisphaerae bacterium]|jgi:hypothetical protein|nr:hypothetical protein [Phycisphaerae bacterium]
MRLHLLPVLLLLPFLAACSAYHPLKQGVGYTDVPVGTDSVLVTFSGDSSMSVAETRKYALIRASELAALRGMPYFKITNEHVYITHSSTYWPPTESTYVTSVENRHGVNRPFIVRDYDPGYTQFYTLTEDQLQVKLSPQGGEGAIPAAYLLRQARAENIKLAPGVEEKLASLPGSSGPAAIPPAPTPTTKPLIAPASKPATEPAATKISVN